MTHTPHILLVAVALGIIGAGEPRSAFAEEGELRVTVAPVIAARTVEAFGVATDAKTFGGQASVAHGLDDSLEVGAIFVYHTRADLLFAGPSLSGITGDDLTLYANLQSFQAGSLVRYLVGGSTVPLFARLHPTVEFAAGVSHRRLSNLMAFTGGGTFAGDVALDASWAPYVAAQAGAAFRWTDHLQLGLLVAFTALGPDRSVGALVELSWQGTSPLAP